MKKILLAGASALFACTPAALLAEEGMWLPSQTASLADDLKAAGLELDPEKLGDLQQPPLTAIVSLGGCSAAFLSPQGLVATNHHCVAGSLQYNSSPEADYLTNGFLAATLGHELPAAPGSRIYVIEDLRDVTGDMMAGADKLDGRARHETLQANRTRLIEQCEQLANRRCDVRPYFGGQQYWLQQQLEIKDVRLVYAPAAGVGNFGGETDNWMWPRHTGDFAFYRAYVAPDGSSATFSQDNVPFKPSAWLKIAEEGVKEGDFIMVAGFPGTTDRLRSAEEARFYYEELYPYQQQTLADYSAQINGLTEGNEAAKIAYAATLQGVDNYKKKIAGQLQGADAISLIERKATEEAAFRNWVNADRARSRRYAPALAQLDRLVNEANASALAGIRTAMLSRGHFMARPARSTAGRSSRKSPMTSASRATSSAIVLSSPSRSSGLNGAMLPGLIAPFGKLASANIARLTPMIALRALMPRLKAATLVNSTLPPRLATRQSGCNGSI
jgi:hypothetical protein